MLLMAELLGGAFLHLFRRFSTKPFGS